MICNHRNTLCIGLVC